MAQNKHFLTFEVKQKSLNVNYDQQEFLKAHKEDLKRSCDDIEKFIASAMKFFKEEWDMDFGCLATPIEFLYDKKGSLDLPGDLPAATLKTYTFSRESYGKEAPFRIVSEVRDTSDKKSTSKAFGRHAVTDTGLSVLINEDFTTPNKKIEMKKGWFVWIGSIDVRGIGKHIYFRQQSLIPIGKQSYEADGKILTAEFFETNTDYENLGKGRGMGTIYILKDGSAVGEYVLNWDLKDDC